jgi:hypothetical protein
MSKKINPAEKKKLALKKERLRELTPRELGNVVGGAVVGPPTKVSAAPVSQ